MRNSRMSAVVGGVVAATFLLAGCTDVSGDAGQMPAASVAPTTTPTPTETRTVAPRPTETFTAADSPLAAYVTPVTLRESIALGNKQEQLTAQCMTDRGFPYTAIVTAEDIAAPEGAPEPASRAWAEEFAYSVFDSPGRASAANEPQEVDPNQQYYATLSAEDQAAYLEAINGAEGAQSWQESGCFGESYQAVFGGNPWESEHFRPIVNGVKSIYDKTQSDPHTIELKQHWATCMADAGYPGLTDRGLTPDLGHADSSTMLGKRESEGWQGRTTRTSSGSVRWICTSPRRARR